MGHLVLCISQFWQFSLSQQCLSRGRDPTDSPNRKYKSRESVATRLFHWPAVLVDQNLLSISGTSQMISYTFEMPEIVLGPNSQIQCFTMGRLERCAENAKKTPKLEKLKRKLLKILNMYDLYRGVPCESWRPELSENVVVFEISRFQSLVKFGAKILLRRRRYEKKTRPQFWFLGPETNSLVFKHGWQDVLFVSDLKNDYCGRVFFS